MITFLSILSAALGLAVVRARQTVRRLRRQDPRYCACGHHECSHYSRSSGCYKILCSCMHFIPSLYRPEIPKLSVLKGGGRPK